MEEKKNMLIRRKGSQEYRTVVAKNKDDYFPTTDYSKYLNNCSSVLDLAVRLPSVESIYGKYLQIASNPRHIDLSLSDL